MATVYNAMLYGGLALSVIFAVVAVILFIKLNIPKVLGEITGRTEKKQIEQIREKGYESVQGAGVSKKDAIKTSTSKISVRDVKTSETEVSKRAKKRYENSIKDLNRSGRHGNGEEDTTVLGGSGVDEEATNVLGTESYEAETDVLRDNDEMATDVLRDDDEMATDVLTSDDDEMATDVLTSDDDEMATDVLTSMDDDGATDILSNVEDLESEYEATDVLTSDTPVKRQSSVVKIIKDVVIVHSNESI